MLRCPVCLRPLARSASSYLCPRGHSFDVARSGYVNLLRSQRLAGQRRGDSPEMLRCRRAFLDAGHYAPLAGALASLARHLDPARFLDAGCGEGTFTASVSEGLGTRPVEAWGLDVARIAADMAARRHVGLAFAVASVHELPIADRSVTCLLSAFAPSDSREFRRVLDPAGAVVTVRPGQDHLVELRRRLYRELRAPGRATAVELPDFQAVLRADLGFALMLRAADVANLLGMTPYAWRTSAAVHQSIVQAAPLEITAQFRITVLRLRPPV